MPQQLVTSNSAPPPQAASALTTLGRGGSLTYSLPALVLAPMAISFYVFTPKIYADLGTISVQALGIAVLLTRVWDAVTDPLIGYLSDRTVSPAGRRKPWLKRSLVPLCLSFVLLFAAPLIPAPLHLFWFTGISVLFFLCWTMYAIPYEALGQELVSDYDQRTVLFSFRDGAVVTGTLIAALVPLFTESYFSELDTTTRWLGISSFYSLLLILFTVICLRALPNGIQRPVQISNFSPRRSFRTTCGNPHFRKLVIAYTISSFGAALPATLFLFYVDSVLQSANGPAFLALYFLIGILALPLWTKLSFYTSKKSCWLAAMLLNTTGFLGVFFLSAGQEFEYAILISISALGYGASLALPSSMQADVIDSEELETGFRREGEFLGVWSLAKKTSAALGAGAALWVLGASGFEPQLSVQGPDALLALRALYCLVPCVCSFGAMVVISRYSLSRDDHARIRNDIDRRAVGVTP